MVRNAFGNHLLHRIRYIRTPIPHPHIDAYAQLALHQLRLAQLRQLTTSRAAATALAENYTAAATETLDQGVVPTLGA